MNRKPPRIAAWVVEMFAPMECAEGVLGDLEEEFAVRLGRSGHHSARRWYWRQALRTSVHLVWGGVRAAPWTTTTQAMVSLVVVLLLYFVMNRWVMRLVGGLPIYDYDASIWSWRVASFVRLVVLPLALGWSIAAFARGRAMIITTLVVSVLTGMALLTFTVNALPIYLGLGQRLGLSWTLIHALEFILAQAILPLGLFVGGMMRRVQQLRGFARIAM